MKRIDTTNAVANLHGEGKSGFGPGNPVTGTKATYLSAAWCNAIQEEIARVIEGAGIPLDAAKYDQLKTAIDLLIASALEAIPGDMLRRAVNTPDLAAGYYITPLALEIVGGVVTPTYIDRNVMTLAVTESITLAAPEIVPAGGGARIIATIDATGNRALTLASAYRVIDGEWAADAGVVNILDMVFGGPGGLIDVQISQRGEA